MNKRRLMTVVTFMQSTVPHEQFSMDTFLRYEHERPYSVGELDEPLVLGDCGSKGCVLGWLPSIPALRKAGWIMLEGEPLFRGFTNAFESAQKFFGLTESQAEELFGASAKGILRTSMTPKRWARMALRCITKWEKKHEQKAIDETR